MLGLEFGRDSFFKYGPGYQEGLNRITNETLRLRFQTATDTAYTYTSHFDCWRAVMYILGRLNHPVDDPDPGTHLGYTYKNEFPEIAKPKFLSLLACDTYDNGHAGFVWVESEGNHLVWAKQGFLRLPVMWTLQEVEDLNGPPKFYDAGLG